MTISEQKEIDNPAEVSSLDPRSTVERQTATRQAINFVCKEYLSSLPDYSILPVDQQFSQLSIEEYTQMFQLTDIVYAKDEDFLQKAVTVLYTAYALDASVIMLLQCNGKSNEYYMGVSCPEHRENIGELFQGFQGAFCGNFPGSQVKRLTNEALHSKVKTIFDTPENVFSSISGVPALRNLDKHSIQHFIQGIENLINSLRGSVYTLIVQATPVSRGELMELRHGYEQIHTSLSPFSKSECAYNGSESIGTNSSVSESVSDGETNTVTDTESKSKTHTESHTDGTSESKSRNNGAIVGGVILAAGAVAVAAAPAIAAGLGVSGIAAALAAPAGMSLGTVTLGGTSSGIGGLIGTKTEGSNHTDTKSDGDTVGTLRSKGKSLMHNSTTGTTDGMSEQTTTGRSVQFTVEDKTIQSTQKIVEENLERLKKCESFGTFSSCAYVISNSASVNKRVAAVYAALMRGDTSFTQNAQIHTWENSHPSYKGIKAFLQHFLHPQFEYPIGMNCAVITPALLLSGEELALQIGLPKRSLPGISVCEIAEFGCNPPVEMERAIELGTVQHLGQPIAVPVYLNKNSLTAHTFITGSTGSGKSNTIYQMLDKLTAQEVKFLAVEPAKGEYKDVFGGRKDVAVYGTNPYLTPLLKINPFSFPNGILPQERIHVLEHMDRLVEIFNVCWPMYAAMPAVLKEAIERAYISAGWDLRLSANRSGYDIFPTFQDVLHEIQSVINESEYSGDTKGDYKGALITRLRSLTNGLNGQIFSAEELSGEQLFDQNVIVDLSRVGSTETKALIMGLLVMKLQEHRMTHRQGSNSELRHVTVLEEAHNLLKRTSTEQTSEGANLLGKSVEMLTNAIAEMRTYGEGFIIADQAPGLLDMAVIRNTNTKIILRLPEQYDRELVGKSAGLNDAQIVELSKLKCGVAAVYQNGWLEPVLCKIDKFPNQSVKPLEPCGAPHFSDQPSLKNLPLEIVLGRTVVDRQSVQHFMHKIIISDLTATNKLDLLDYLTGTRDTQINACARLAYRAFNSEQAINIACRDSTDGIQSWIEKMKSALRPPVSNFSQEEINRLVALILQMDELQNPEHRGIRQNYLETVWRDKN